MSLANFEQAHDWFYKDHTFEWQSDLSRLGKIDKWVILKPSKDETTKGDCEDAALTIINHALLNQLEEHSLKSNFNAEKIQDLESRYYVCRVATQQCPKDHVFDHAVGLYIDDDGKWWLSDNRHPSAVYSLFGANIYTFYDAVSLANMRGEGVPKLIKKKRK